MYTGPGAGAAETEGQSWVHRHKDHSGADTVGGRARPGEHEGHSGLYWNL